MSEFWSAAKTLKTLNRRTPRQKKWHFFCGRANLTNEWRQHVAQYVLLQKIKVFINHCDFRHMLVILLLQNIGFSYCALLCAQRFLSSKNRSNYRGGVIAFSLLVRKQKNIRTPDIFYKFLMRGDRIYETPLSFAHSSAHRTPSNAHW